MIVGSRKLTIGDYINYFILGFITIISFIPIVHLVAGTFATEEAMAQSGLLLWLTPDEFSTEAVRYILSSSSFISSFYTTVKVTVVGTAFNMLMTVLFAYPLSHKTLCFRPFLMRLVVFTMVFNAGMIPHYMNMRELNLLDSFWALVIPSAINTYNMILIKTYFEGIPEELRESAKIDGCSHLRTLVQIILPLSKPVLATVGLFYAVYHWNAYLPAMLYIKDPDMWPMQVLLRNIVMLSQMDLGTGGETISSAISPTSLKYATIFVATAPILMLYPFLQKYFVKGVMMGSVKG